MEPKAATRFDLEQSIMHCWGILDDIQILQKHNASSDAYAALAVLYQIHFEELFAIFDEVIKERSFYEF